MKRIPTKALWALLLIWSLGVPSAAPATLNSGDTAWMLSSSALVLLMTPGLAFFYGGLVRGRAVLNTMMMSFITIGVVGVLWIVAGYTLAFGSGTSPLIGGLGQLRLAGMSNQLNGTIPAYAYMIFQAMFAIITPALISGALIDRMRFGPFVLFVALWSLVVYAPLAHWVWAPDGWLAKLGALDFAGGTVVHMSSGFSALVAAWVLGPRLRSSKQAAIPHNIPFVLLGAGLLWFGWFGFNAGSALAADQTAALAFVTTNTATAAAMLAWVLWEVLRGQKPSAVGAATGAVVGLVAITPAAGFVSPMASIAVGALGATVCFWAVQWKPRGFLRGVDDALDVFSCHGLGGMAGAILTGIFAFTTASGVGTIQQIGIQLVGVLATILIATVGTFVLLKLIGLFFPLRASADEESLGIDLAAHEESGYTSDDLGYVASETMPISAPVVLSGSSD